MEKEVVCVGVEEGRRGEGSWKIYNRTIEQEKRIALQKNQPQNKKLEQRLYLCVVKEPTYIHTRIGT